MGPATPHATSTKKPITDDSSSTVILPGGKTTSPPLATSPVGGMSFRAMASMNIPASTSPKAGVSVVQEQPVKASNDMKGGKQPLKFGTSQAAGNVKDKNAAVVPNIPPRTHSAPPAMEEAPVRVAPVSEAASAASIPIVPSAAPIPLAPSAVQVSGVETQQIPPYGYQGYMPRPPAYPQMYGMRPPYPQAYGYQQPQPYPQPYPQMNYRPEYYGLPYPRPMMMQGPPTAGANYISYTPSSTAAVPKPAAPARKAIAIVDPSTGQAINPVKAAINMPEKSIQSTSVTTSVLASPKTPVHVVIVNPVDNKEIELPPKKPQEAAEPIAAVQDDFDELKDTLDNESDIFSDADILDDEEDLEDEEDEEEEEFTGPRLLKAGQKVDYPRTIIPFTPPTDGVWRYDRGFLMQFSKICTWKPDINLEIPIAKLARDPNRRSEYRTRAGDRRRGAPPTVPGGPPAVLTNRAADAWGRLGEKVMAEDQKILRDVKGLLNKLTIEKFDTISDKMISLGIISKTIMPGTIDLIFDKAVEEPKFSSMYARLCLKIVKYEHEEATKKAASGSGETSDASSVITTGTFGPKIDSAFRKYIVSKCQVEYENKRAWSKERLDKIEAAAKAKADSEANPTVAPEANATAEAAPSQPAQTSGDLTEEDYARIKLKRRVLGNMRFIGELYNVGLIGEKIMHAVIIELLSNTSNPEEEEIESFCRLFITVGPKLDTPAASKQIECYLARMTTLTTNTALSTRVRFMVLDVLDHRKAKWAGIERDVPKSLGDLQKEIEAKQAEAAARDKQRQQPRDRRGTPVSSTGSARSRDNRGDAREYRGDARDHRGDARDLHHSNHSTSSLASTGSARSFQTDRSSRRNQSQQPSRFGGFTEAKSNARMSPALRPEDRPGSTVSTSSRYDILLGTDQATHHEDEGCKEVSIAVPWDKDLALGKLKSAFSEFLQYKKVADFIEVWTAEIPTEAHTVSLSFLISLALDREPAVKALAGPLLEAINPAPKVIQAALRESFTPIDDLAVDLPRAFEFGGKILAASLSLGHFSQPDVLPSILADVEDSAAKAKLLLHMFVNLPASTPVESDLLAALSADDRCQSHVSKMTIKANLLSALPFPVQTAVLKGHFTALAQAFEPFLQAARPSILEPALNSAPEPLLYAFSSAAFSRLHRESARASQKVLESEKLPTLFACLSAFPESLPSYQPLLAALVDDFATKDEAFVEATAKGLLGAGVLEPAIFKAWRAQTTHQIPSLLAWIDQL